VGTEFTQRLQFRSSVLRYLRSNPPSVTDITMVSIEVIRASNASIATSLPPGLVALFVGGTSGIGENTMKQFYATAPSPRVYFVGRSQASADRIIEAVKPLNPDGKLQFIQADVSLLKNVDEVCRKFSEEEKELNLLVMTQGFLTLDGRTETKEKIDTKLSLNYFSRAKFIQNLLPILSTTASSSKFGARVLSVLAAGEEGKINSDDMELRNTFSLKNAATHAITFNSASFQYLSTKYPDIAFIHAFPGTVATPMFDNGKFNPIVKGIGKIAVKLFSGLLTTPEESGARHLWLTTNEKFKTGAWLMNEKGEEAEKSKIAEKKGFIGVTVGEKVWNYSEELFATVEKDGKAYSVSQFED